VTPMCSSFEVTPMCSSFEATPMGSAIRLNKLMDQLTEWQTDEQ
jgi:hypothetical protein